MKYRNLGSEGLIVSEVGLGCMGMTYAYGQRNDPESIETIAMALDSGVTLFDTAEVYGPYTNEEVLGKGLGSRRTKVSVATKFGFKLNGNQVTGLDSSPENIRRVVHSSLSRLGTDYIDLLYQHRVDPTIPIEDVAGTVRDLISEGKVRYFGLSEAGAATVQRAHAICPVSAVQVEYSLWVRGAERTLAHTLKALGIGLVAYSPLGRGFLAGSVPSPANLDKSDYRNFDPRMRGENYEANLAIAHAVKAVAQRMSATPAQVCIAWLLQTAPTCVPIPGTKRIKYLSENLAASALKISDEDMVTLGRLADNFPILGSRYSGAMRSMLDTDF